MGIIGAILGDIALSRFEFVDRHHHPPANAAYNLFETQNGTGNSILSVPPYFTDDTVMSIATMVALNTDKDYEKSYVDWVLNYPDAGYGAGFYGWATQKSICRKPYNSFGNGSAMRIGYIGQYYKKCPFEIMVRREANRSASVTHNHPEGIKGAETTAICVWKAERGKSKENILQYAISQYPSAKYRYGCDIPVSQYQKSMSYEVSCMGSVPVAIRCFYESDSFESCMKLINSMECDADTLGAIAGAICESYYGYCIDKEMDKKILNQYLDERMIDTLKKYKII